MKKSGRKWSEATMIFNREAETMSRKEIEAVQLERLKRIVRYCYDNRSEEHTSELQ